MDNFQELKDLVWQEVREAVRKTNQQESFWEVLAGFVHAVNWREPWIQGLLGIHICLLVLTITLRKHPMPLSGIFFLAVGIIYFAENLNSLAAENWQKFSEQQYFDDRGVFFSTVISAPLLLVMFLILVLYLLNVSFMMIEVKKKQLQVQARRRQQQAGGQEQKKDM